jgi:hypothetical protein
MLATNLEDAGGGQIGDESDARVAAETVNWLIENGYDHQPKNTQEAIRRVRQAKVMREAASTLCELCCGDCIRDGLTVAEQKRKCALPHLASEIVPAVVNRAISE